jgi:hypothetical protein
MVFDVYVEDEACIASLMALAAEAPIMCAAGVNLALEEGKEMAEADIKVDTGAARSLIDIIPATPTTIFDAQLRSMADYSGYIENVEGGPFARSPGSRAPPASALMGWASRHGSTEGYTDQQFAYVLARSIGEKGVESKPYIAYLAKEKLPALLEAQVTLALDELAGVSAL